MTSDSRMPFVSSGPGAPIPRTSIGNPREWADAVRRNSPLHNMHGWICFDDDSYVLERDPITNQKKPEGITKPLPVIGTCRVCLKEDGSRVCSQCRSIAYCSKDCQRRHWKECHKKACEPNPKRYKVYTDLRQFHGLAPAYFAGHEFITIKPTERLLPQLAQDDNNNSNLLIAAICEDALESADHIFDIPGFGMDQLEIQWPAENARHPISQAILKKFGWTSGAYSVEPVDGYRSIAEEKVVYHVLNDDAFLNPEKSPGLAINYYGQGCFNYIFDKGEGTGSKDVRGNLVIYKLMIRTKHRVQQTNTEDMFQVLYSDDYNVRFDYSLLPICKAEIAHMLLERRKAAAQGAFTRRVWRSRIRRKEIPLESHPANSMFLF